MAIDNLHAGIILKRILENGFSISDQITLVSGKDGQRFPIHRNVLTATSKTFRTALGQNLRKKQKTEFIWEDADGETVKAIVDFCYTGIANLTDEILTKVLPVAASIQFDLLEDKCRQIYKDKLSINNGVDTLLVADKYGYVDLRQHSLDFISKSFDLVPTKDIQRLDHQLMLEILKCGKIQATEELVFKRLLEWFEYNEDERKQHMATLLKLIRLEHISSQFFENNSLEATYNRFGCSDIVAKELKKCGANKDANIGVRRCRSIYCLFAQYKGEDFEYSAVKIEQYNSQLSRYEEAGEIQLGGRRGFGLILQNNRIYVMGGSTNGVCENSVSAYDLTTREEEIMPGMNLARYDFASVLIGKYIYVFGGVCGPKYSKSCERFDTETKTWEIIKPMNVARDSAGVAVLNEYIYVAGGKQMFPCTQIHTVEQYDPKKDEWVKLAPMPASRQSFALFKSKEFLYAIGDKDGIERYDPSQNSWKEIGSFKANAFISGAIEVDDQIVAIMQNGKFGRIKLNKSGKCSFNTLSKSKYDGEYSSRHYLFRN